jgi:hypothetical protein
MEEKVPAAAGDAEAREEHSTERFVHGALSGG